MAIWMAPKMVLLSALLRDMSSGCSLADLTAMPKDGLSDL